MAVGSAVAVERVLEATVVHFEPPGGLCPRVVTPDCPGNREETKKVRREVRSKFG
jgi:hypothetical protein